MRKPVRNPLIGIAVGVVGLAGISVGQDLPNRHHVERDLTRRAESALVAGGVGGTTVHFTGRDGEVVVASGADVDRARRIVGAQTGVRAVTVKAPPTNPAPAPAAPKDPTVTVTATVDGGQISLTGTVRDKTALVTSLGGTVDDRLSVDANTADKGLADFAKVVKALGTDAVHVTVALTAGGISVTGTVSSQATKDAVDRAATVDDRLLVAPVQAQLGSLPNVTFENNSAQLTVPGQAVVAQVADILKAHPTVHVSIEGHTDGTGTAATNLVLSQQRAETVRQTLVAAGIDAGRLTAAGFGATRPKVPDDTDANRAINRRVEFIVVSQ